jgi:chemotaxis protein MotD
MTMEVAMGLVSPVSARGGERSGKSGGDAGAFDRALAEKPAKSASQKPDSSAPETEPRWKLAALGEKYPPARQEPSANEAYDSFREMLLPLETAEAGVEDDEILSEAGLPGNDAGADADLADAGPDAVAAAMMMRPSTPADQRGAIAEAAGKRMAANGTDDAAEGVPTRSASALASDAATGGDRPAEAATSRLQTASQVSAAVAQDRPAVEPVRVDARAGRQAAPAPTPIGAAASAVTTEAGGARAGTGDAMPEEILRQLEAVRMSGRTAGTTAQPRGEAIAAAQGGADKAQPTVSVLGFSNSSAPVIAANIAPAGLAAPLSTTGAGVVAAIEAEPTWRAAAADAVTQRGGSNGVVSSLRIQLNPAELGMVTARLVASGSQLEIEIRVESNDARQKLANDADAIVKALRGVGYDVERVTIHQGPQGGASAQPQGTASRDPFMQQGQQQDQAGANAGGRNGQASGNGANAAQRNPGEPGAERPGGGVYI